MVLRCYLHNCKRPRGAGGGHAGTHATARAHQHERLRPARGAARSAAAGYRNVEWRAREQRPLTRTRRAIQWQCWRRRRWRVHGFGPGRGRGRELCGWRWHEQPVRGRYTVGGHAAVQADPSAASAHSELAESSYVAHVLAVERLALATARYVSLPQFERVLSGRELAAAAATNSGPLLRWRRRVRFCRSSSSTARVPNPEPESRAAGNCARRHRPQPFGRAAEQRASRSLHRAVGRVRDSQAADNTRSRAAARTQQQPGLDVGHVPLSGLTPNLLYVRI